MRLLTSIYRFALDEEDRQSTMEIYLSNLNRISNSFPENVKEKLLPWWVHDGRVLELCIDRDQRIFGCSVLVGDLSKGYSRASYRFYDVYNIRELRSFFIDFNRRLIELDFIEIYGDTEALEFSFVFISGGEFSIVCKRISLEVCVVGADAWHDQEVTKVRISDA